MWPQKNHSKVKYNFLCNNVFLVHTENIVFSTFVADTLIWAEVSDNTNVQCALGTCQFTLKRKRNLFIRKNDWPLISTCLPPNSFLGLPSIYFKFFWFVGNFLAFIVNSSSSSCKGIKWLKMFCMQKCAMRNRFKGCFLFYTRRNENYLKQNHINSFRG